MNCLLHLKVCVEYPDAIRVFAGAESIVCGARIYLTGAYAESN
jgi:hypothetical protein